jgi:hypothetical protein
MVGRHSGMTLDMAYRGRANPPSMANRACLLQIKADLEFLTADAGDFEYRLQLTPNVKSSTVTYKS